MGNKILIAAGIISIGISLSYLYGRVVICDPQGKFVKIKQKFDLTENRIRVNFDLSEDSYLLQVKHKIGDGRDKNILFNDQKVTANTWPYTRERENNQTSYIYLPKESVKKGKNTVDITFMSNAPKEIYIILRNHRKCTASEIYVLFPDSAHLPAGENLFTAMPFTNILILLLGVGACFTDWGTFVKGRIFRLHQRYLLLVLSILLFLFFVGWISANLGYRVVITPVYFRKVVFIILGPFVAIYLYILISYSRAATKKTQNCFLKAVEVSSDFLLKASRFCFAEKKFSTRTGLAFLLLIILVNLYAYWPSFFHLFRHDEWALFFSSRDVTPNLGFIIKHIDWQLKLPYDHLNFRPLLTTGLAINRVIFDDNYIGPHIIAFVKHLITTLMIWFMMWQMRKEWCSALFALLFSLLLTGADPVIWPHIDAYIITTLFILLTLSVSISVINERISTRYGLKIISALIFVGLLTSQLSLILPFVLFVVCWFVFNKNKDKLKTAFIYFFSPLVLWALLFGIHLYWAFPLNMTEQSGASSLWKIPVNIGCFILLSIAGVLVPINTPSFRDKMYVNFSYLSLLLTFIVIGLFFFSQRGKMRRFLNAETALLLLTMLGVVSIVCLTRGRYIENTLSNLTLPSYCVYCVNALLILVIYRIVAFQSLRLQVITFLILVFLIFTQGIKTFSACEKVEMHTKPLKKYFDAVVQFIQVHQKESNFSFKMIDRPPKVKVFYWYTETCIDGLFNKFINNETPKYLLEYDYSAEKLISSAYNKNQKQAVDSNMPVNLPKSDYINSIGMPFKKIVWGKRNFFIGMFEVTQKQWYEVMGSSPSKFVNYNHPVENVSYYMVQDFINRLNKIEGCNSYRLPKEKEYLLLLNSSPDTVDLQNKNIDKYAWLKDNSAQTTHSVGLLGAVPAGFYDLIGNVWEWTQNPIYYDATVKPFKDSPHICFGCSWRDGNINTDGLQTNYPLDFRHENLGFRLVREDKQSE